MTPGSIVSEEFTALQRAVAGRYAIVREIGRGATGVVFLARDETLDRLVAIKTLQLKHADLPAARDAFVQAARRAAQLTHPNVVRIHAVTTAGDLDYLVMDYINGESLAARLARVRVLTAAETTRLMQEVAWALSHAQGRGMTHGQLHVGNILLEADGGRSLVGDFGRDESAPGSARDNPVQADLRALGRIGYRAISGREVADTVAEWPALSAALPAGLLEAIRRALSEDAAVRWSGANAMGQALAAARAVEPSTPVALRSFARELLEDGERFAMVGTVGLASTTVFLVFFRWLYDWLFDSKGPLDFGTGGFLDFTGGEFGVLGYLGLGVAVAVLFGTLARIRRVSAAGFRRSHALAAADQLDREERESSPRRASRRWWRSSPGIVIAAVFGTVVGAILSVYAGGMNNRHAPMWEYLPVLLGGDSLAVISLVRLIRWCLDRRSGRTSLWVEFWRGPAGLWLWRVARIGLNRVRPAPQPGERTTVVLRQTIADLFAQLEPAHRAQLGDVVDLAARLEDLASHASPNEVVGTVKAMELLRLDLLDLRAGRRQVSSIMTDIEHLAEIGRDVDVAINKVRA